MPCEGRGKDWRDTYTRQGTARIAGNYQRLGQRHGTDSENLQKEPTLPMPAFQISSLQNHERKKFCCFKLSSVCSMLQQQEETDTPSKEISEFKAGKKNWVFYFHFLFLLPLFPQFCSVSNESSCNLAVLTSQPLRFAFFCGSILISLLYSTSSFYYSIFLLQS